jgi:hypothetical protein
MQDDATSTTLSPSSQSPSPPFLKLASSPSDSSSTSQSSSDQDEIFDLFNQDCDVIIPGTEDLFGHRSSEHGDNWEGNLSAEKLDSILLRAEARLKEQEELAQKLDLAAQDKSNMAMPKPSLKTTYMDTSKQIVHPNNETLVSKEARSHANKPRVVNDCISSKQTKEKSKISMLSI